ncbi:hypothetical protein [Mucisphaera sp.]|uniref:hypothetical protein n=1 Tax=Mucisphaera sp. TaxID=2913024 RepID=UPI003D116453
MSTRKNLMVALGLAGALGLSPFMMGSARALPETDRATVQLAQAGHRDREMAELLETIERAQRLQELIEERESYDYEDEEEAFFEEIELFSRLLGLVHEVADIAEDEGVAGVAAVMGVEDYIEEPRERIAFFERVMPETDHPTIRRAIRLELSELYGETGQREKGLAMLEALITTQD